jgi:hypothetical protein
VLCSEAKIKENKEYHCKARSSTETQTLSSKPMKWLFLPAVRLLGRPSMITSGAILSAGIFRLPMAVHIDSLQLSDALLPSANRWALWTKQCTVSSSTMSSANARNNNEWQRSDDVLEGQQHMRSKAM